MDQLPRQMESTQVPTALYMAMELSARRWMLGFGVGMASRVRRRTIAAGDRAALQREVTAARAHFGVPAEAPVRSCYEAGRDGFWVHRAVTTAGVSNVVVDSASIEVNRRARRLKTDRLDVEKLLRLLVRYWSGERAVWQVVHVPTVAVEDARHAERAIAALVQDRTRQRNRIHSLLALHGRRLRLTTGVGAALETLTDWQGAALPPGVVARIAVAWRQLGQVETELRAARRAQRAAVRAGGTPAAQRAARLRQLVGLNTGSALVLAKEVFARDLRNRRQVGALSGLVSVPYQSGDVARGGGVSRAGLRLVRGRLVELAWAWVKWQPESALSRWYQRRFATGGARLRRIGIVALARKLLIALWRYSEAGIVPPGARLRA